MDRGAINHESPDYDVRQLRSGHHCRSRASRESDGLLLSGVRPGGRRFGRHPRASGLSGSAQPFRAWSPVAPAVPRAGPGVLIVSHFLLVGGPIGNWAAVRRGFVSRVLLGGLCLIGGLGSPSPILSQSRAGSTRIELETIRDLARSGSLDLNSMELMEIERRLSSGDFSVGDQISLQVIGETSLTSTFTVDPGPSLMLPDMPLISLAGVLRSELDDHLTE